MLQDVSSFDGQIEGITFPVQALRGPQSLYFGFNIGGIMIKKLTIFAINLMCLDMFAGGCCSTPQVAPQPQPVIIQQAIINNNTQVIRIAAAQEIQHLKQQEAQRKEDANKGLVQQELGAQLLAKKQAQAAMGKLLGKYQRRLDLISTGQTYSSSDWNKDADLINNLCYEDEELVKLKLQVIYFMTQFGTAHAKLVLEKGQTQQEKPNSRKSSSSNNRANKPVQRKAKQKAMSTRAKNVGKKR